MFDSETVETKNARPCERSRILQVNNKDNKSEQTSLDHQRRCLVHLVRNHDQDTIGLTS